MKYQLTFKEKVGQKFIFGINNNNIEDIIKLIKEYAIGGVILYKKNYQSYEEMLSVIKKLKDANSVNKIPLFITIDQEGGVVNRLPREIHNMRSIHDISKTNQSLVYDAAKIYGNVLRNTGINMNLAPVLDIDNNSKSKALYKRCFYGDVEDISKCGKLYIRGLTDEKIIAVCKHFPGHGVSKIDSHFLVPYIFNNKKITEHHILPFKKVLDNSVDAVMLGHLVIRKMTQFLPASISSKFIKEEIRDSLNYKGIVMTDEIKMLSRNLFYRWIYLKKTVLSDGDITLIKINSAEEGIKIMNKASGYLINSDKLDNSVNRIIKVKEKYNITDDNSLNDIDIGKINDKIDEINNKVQDS